MDGREKERTSGIAKKMMRIFMVLLTTACFVLFLSNTFIYGRMVDRVSKVNLGDLADQTMNNLESAIDSIEDIHVQILASPVVQEQLRISNSDEVNSFTIRSVDLTLERELATSVLLNPNITSANIVSRTGIEYSITNIDGDPIECAFTEEEIYAANGTTLWKLIGEDNNICTAKAILDLKTMMPLGYANIVFRQEYFEKIVQDNSTEFSSYTYVVDEEGTIISANKGEFLNESFPFPLEQLGEGFTHHYDVLNQENAFFYMSEKMANNWILVQSVSTRELSKNIEQNVAITGGLLALMLILGFIAVRVATRYVVKPAKDLVESMKLFGEGNLSHRVEASVHDEIGQIGREYNRMADNIEILIEKVYKMEIAQKQAEIDFLCMQINPHFLYNTLDTISWMAIVKQENEISEMTIALAELLRAMIKSERFVTVEEEMRTVKDYLYIQEQRFENRFTVKYTVDEAANPCVIPNFILQPLIENAIIHGLEPKLDMGTLWVEVIRTEEHLIFRVTDDGVGMTEEEIKELYEKCETNDETQNIGLKNVYRRLILCYGNNSRLSIESIKNEGTRIEFRVPVNLPG